MENHDLLVKRRDREEHSQQNRAAETDPVSFGPDEDGECRCQQNVEKNFGIRLVALKRGLSRGDRPKRRRDKTGNRTAPTGSAGKVASDKRCHCRYHIHEKNGIAAVTGDPFSRRVGCVDGRRLMIPQIAVEIFPVQHLVRDHSVSGQIPLQRFVVSMQSEQENQPAEPGQRCYRKSFL